MDSKQEISTEQISRYVRLVFVRLTMGDGVKLVRKYLLQPRHHQKV